MGGAIDMSIWMPSWGWLAPLHYMPTDRPVEEPDALEEPDAAPVTPLGSLTTVGAWCGLAAIRDPAKHVQFAADHGITRLDIILNDHSSWREPKRFKIRNRSRILRLVNTAKMRGIQVHFMSWVMPYSDYIKQAADVLIPLCEEAQASSLVWDAEEPWTQARHRMSYRAAADVLKSSFRDLPASCSMGVTGIGYAPVRKLGPLADVCGYTIPQAYSTKSSGLKPSTAPVKFQRRWASKFGRPVVVGLAAYRQRGIPGHSPSSAILAAADAASEVTDTVVYWSLSSIRRSPEVARAIASLRYRPPKALTVS